MAALLPSVTLHFKLKNPQIGGNLIINHLRSTLNHFDETPSLILSTVVNKRAGALGDNYSVSLNPNHPLGEDAKHILMNISKRYPDVTFVRLSSNDQAQKPDFTQAQKPDFTQEVNPYVREKATKGLDPRFDPIGGATVTFSTPMSREELAQRVAKSLNTDPSVNDCPPGMICPAVVKRVYTQEDVAKTLRDLTAALQSNPVGPQTRISIDFQHIPTMSTSAMKLDELLHSLGHYGQIQSVTFTSEPPTSLVVRPEPSTEETPSGVVAGDQTPVQPTPPQNLEESSGSVTPWVVVGGVCVGVLGILFYRVYRAQR